MKLTAAQKKQLEKALPHITGECMCPIENKECLYWKKVDTDSWERGVQTKEIIKELERL